MSKRSQSLLYKLHPTEKSSKSSDWWESWECILILYFYFHHSTWFQSRHHTLQPMGKFFFHKYSELPGDWPLLHFGRFKSQNLKITYLVYIFSIFGRRLRILYRTRFPPCTTALKSADRHTSIWYVILILRGRKYLNL